MYVYSYSLAHITAAIIVVGGDGHAMQEMQRVILGLKK